MILIIDHRFPAIEIEKGEENLKIVLLKRIINDELKVRMPKNIKRMRKLKDEFEDR